jgi:hypothetical protein
MTNRVKGGSDAVPASHLSIAAAIITRGDAQLAAVPKSTSLAVRRRRV